MSPWPDPCCPECGADLPDRGYKRRPVPRLGGRLRHVCGSCADAIDAQARLFAPGALRSAEERHAASELSEPPPASEEAA